MTTDTTKGFSIFLRPFMYDDYVIINKWRNDREIQSMTGGPVRYVSLEIEKQWVLSKMQNNNSDLYWAICVNDETQRMIGYASLNNIDHLNKSADAGGTVIGEKEMRDGYSIFEVMSIILDYAFNQLNLHRIGASCLPNHYMAPHSLYAMGFVKEGTARDEIYKNGKYQDVDHYSLMREDYEKMCAAGEMTVKSMVKRCIAHIKETNQK